jgi:hypothetical protein
LSMLALLPSRNYVVQVVRILYETEGIDIDTFRQTYRGIIDDYIEKLLYELGVVVERKLLGSNI